MRSRLSIGDSDLGSASVTAFAADRTPRQARWAATYSRSSSSATSRALSRASSATTPSIRLRRRARSKAVRSGVVTGMPPSWVMSVEGSWACRMTTSRRLEIPFVRG